ncbi:helix-turn-helix domain-containing protein (plasmid) [Streptomyces sp. JL4002]|uniref:helix-turn-helix domain-containing protein n=1 Tax=Streptomyces sp. JL4002 TaxID=3404781 RepID=UPI003B288532
MTEDDIAAASGLPLHTWRRRHGADFRARVKVVDPRARLRLYDADQALAHIAGNPIPTLSDTSPHPSDLLTDKEAGALLGIDPSTVRAYASTGYLPKGTDRHGRTWWPRHAVNARRDAGDQRHQNPGQQPGDPRNRAPRPRHDPRIAEIADLARHTPLTTAKIAQRYNVSDRTAQRLLAAARQHATD